MKMYRVAVADDEGITRESLALIIKKNFPGRCLVETAKTGRSAIELAETFRPDIIFMDIRMPGINGMDAIREIRENNPYAVFIVVSAYDKFDYAKEAVSLGVMEYVNKPFSAAKITEVLERAMNAVDSRKRMQSEVLIAREKLENAVSVAESGFVFSLVLNEQSDEKLAGYRSLLGLDDDYGCMMVIVEKDEGALKLCCVEISEILKDVLDCRIGGVTEGRLPVFIPCDSEAMTYEERIKLMDTCHELTRRFLRRAGLSCRIGIGSVRPVRDCGISYREAAEALEMSSGRVVHINDMARPLPGGENGDGSKSAVSGPGIVDRAKEYIQKHYDRDLSLDGVSRQLDISPYYFSRLFKEETGRNFLEYLTSLRIERAKELLKDKSRSIKDIAATVGYSDSNYFSRIFKKNVGLTPTEYREGKQG